MADEMHTFVPMTATQHADYKAFLRFRDAMTPEMWNALDDASANVPQDFRHKLTDLVGARQALDTLCQALQQGRQG